MTGRRLLRHLHPRHIRWWQWLTLVLLVIALLVRSWLPKLLHQQILTQLGTVTPAHVQLGDVDLDFLHTRVALHKLAFTLAGDTQPTLAVDELAAKVNLLALLRREIDIEDVHVNGI